MIPTRLSAFDAAASADTRLGRCARGWSGWVTGLAPTDGLTIPWSEMERRLLEMGFVEGAKVEILHEGPFGRDPLAVRVDDLTVALRRREADVVLDRKSVV
jgi:ferrous iron transport protein A